MRTFYQHDRLTVICGDALESLRQLPDESVQCCVTSPPYWALRDYGHEGQLGLEKTPEEYCDRLTEILRDVRRVLKSDGTLWLNLGDSYCSQGELHDGRSDNQPGVGAKRIWRNGSGRADGIVDERGQRNRNGNSVAGLKSKDLVGIPWMVAFSLRRDGWYLRQDIIWSKPNPMPESVTDRCTKAHEYLFLLTKSARYYYDAAAISERSIVAAPDGTQTDSSKFYETGSDRKDHGRKANGAGYYRSGESWPVENRNKRSVWTVSLQSCAEAHFATYPSALITPCILAGSKAGENVLDPFAGSGTTGMVALELGRKATLIELNPEYCDLIKKRCDVTPGLAL